MRRWGKGCLILYLKIKIVMQSIKWIKYVKQDYDVVMLIHDLNYWKNQIFSRPW